MDKKPLTLNHIISLTDRKIAEQEAKEAREVAEERARAIKDAQRFLQELRNALADELKTPKQNIVTASWDPDNPKGSMTIDLIVDGRNVHFMVEHDDRDPGSRISWLVYPPSKKKVVMFRRKEDYQTDGPSYCTVTHFDAEALRGAVTDALGRPELSGVDDTKTQVDHTDDRQDIGPHPAY